MIAGSGARGGVTGNRSGCLPMMAFSAFQPQISSLHVGAVVIGQCAILIEHRDTDAHVLRGGFIDAMLGELLRHRDAYFRVLMNALCHWAFDDDIAERGTHASARN